MKRYERYAACSFSGDKDSTLALWYPINLGYKVRHLVNFVSYKFKRSYFRGIPIKLIELQSMSIGIPLLRYFVGKSPKSYEKKVY